MPNLIVNWKPIGHARRFGAEIDNNGGRLPSLRPVPGGCHACRG